MMTHTGKIFGFLFGLMLGSPLLAIFGLLVGHFLDIHNHEYRQIRKKSQEKKANPHSSWPPDQSKKVFFTATFTIMGHLAKADGQISKDEIKVAESIMDRLGLNASAKQQAIKLFRAGKQPDFNLNHILWNLKHECKNTHLLHLFIEFQLQTAHADGNLTETKRKILENICRQLDITLTIFHRYQHKQSHTRERTPTLDDDYALLDIDKSASMPEIKKAYRRLMSQNHPDRLIAGGLPDDMIKIATEKTQAIQAAYERICKQHQ